MGAAPTQLRQHKDNAAAFLAKGKTEDAIRELCRAVELSPGDLTLRQRVGELLARIRRTDDAANVYRFVASEYAKDGQVLKAIAVCKIILGLKPDDTQIQKFLARLYANRKEAPALDSGRVSQPPRGTAGTAGARGAAAGAKGPAPRPGTPAHLHDKEIDIELTEDDKEFFRLADEASQPVPAGTPPAAAPVAPETETAITRHRAQTDLSDLDTVMIDLDSLPQIPLFSSMPADAFMAAVNRLRLLSFRRGDYILKEGEHGDALYIVVQGSAGVVRGLKGVEAKPVAVLGRGSFFGEMALIASAPRIVSVIAREDTVVLELKREALEEISAAYPQVIEVAERFYRTRLLANLLQSSPLFEAFSRPEKQAIIEKFRSRTVAAGVNVLEQGQPGQGFFVLFRGVADVIRKDSAGREHAFAKLREGDVFGEISLLLKEPVTATVRSVTGCVVLYLAPEDFEKHILAHPQAAESVRALKDQRLNLTIDFLASIDEPLDSYLL